MCFTDTNDGSSFPVEEIVQFPLPGYVAPSSISFSPDDRLITYLFSPEGTLYRKVFSFDLTAKRQELVFSPPDGGGLDESNLSAEEKLRRERSRRGVGVTRYEWRSTSSGFTGKSSMMVPLPSGDMSGSVPEVKLRSLLSRPSLILTFHLMTHGLAEYIAQNHASGKSSVGSDAQEDHPYPFAGGSNAKVRIGVVSVCGKGSLGWIFSVEEVIELIRITNI
ncbi:hypothetical protein HPP92_028640 [Vanilla planifolia]|uniref:Uncharacterized protein n=1 Tax=Vanilla planifolia TaxID=51239 RepID=A0A835U2X3_VANPL|nr:hypothetical protein HPP92_028640 [Vanilla planifolia]